MNKTLYLRDEDGPVWERARQLAGEKLSPVVVEALKKFVAEKEAEVKGMQRIVVTYRDSADGNIPKAKAFVGRWIIPPEKRWRTLPTNAAGIIVAFMANRVQTFAALATTARGQVVIYSWYEEPPVAGTNTPPTRSSEKFEVFPSMVEAMHSDYGEIAKAALPGIGIPVEELDI
jgi:hypothetical protein